MHYFKLLETGVPVQALREALDRYPGLWNANRARTTFDGTPHGEVDDIWVRFGDSTEDETSYWHPAAELLPEVMPILRGVIFRVGAYQLDRVLISKLVPGAVVERHTDDVGYAAERDRMRLHLVLQGEGGNLYHCGDETVDMKSGELWWFDARAPHACLNVGETDRIHLLIDVRVLPC